MTEDREDVSPLKLALEQKEHLPIFTLLSMLYDRSLVKADLRVRAKHHYKPPPVRLGKIWRIKHPV